MCRSIGHIKILFYALVLCVLIMPQHSMAQEQERPKIGLVLSGGGAKGFAHVGVLKEIEKYNIPIDYIAGTSIGSIIGGLYAIGYSADQIEEMILSQDWEALFINKPERTYLPFYEKEERMRYLLTRPFSDGKLDLPNYAINNGGILRLFSDLTLGYHDVTEFDSLPIPYRCVTVDLMTGKEHVLSSGSLAEAMGASMAIPGVFPSIQSDSAVFVDGGVQNNFPVDHVKAMGADYVIGIDVSSGYQKTREQLDKIGGVIDQLTLLLGKQKYMQNLYGCDLYIQPSLEEYSIADFTYASAVALIDSGKVAGLKAIPQIKHLAQRLNSYDLPSRKNYQPLDTNGGRLITNFNISGTNLHDVEVMGIMGIGYETNMMCELDNLEIALDRLHGSMKFSKIQYRLIENSVPKTYTLELELEEHSENTISFGAHYNSQDGMAMLFNSTFNTLFFKNSRISTDIKLADAPAFDLRYNINRGSLPGLSMHYGFRGRLMKNYQGGVKIGEAEVQKNTFEINTNSVVKNVFTLGLGARYESFSVSQKLGDFPLENNRYNYYTYRFFLKIDTKDKVYYPTSGLKYYSTTDLITDNGYELNGYIPSIVSYLAMEKVISLTDKFVIIPNLYGQLQFMANNPPPVFFDTYVGGIYEPYDIVSQIPFWGLRWGEFKANNIVKLGFDNRYKIAPKHYLYANVNYFAHKASLSDFNVNKLEHHIGGAIGYSFDSLVGPAEIFFSYANGSSLLTYINVGFYF